MGQLAVDPNHLRRLPWANWLLILITCAESIHLFPAMRHFERGYGMSHALNALVLQPEHFRLTQLVGAMFVHAGWIHLLGNMYFLWLFGNALNARLGHWQYLLLYFGTGIVANLAMLWFGPQEPSLGASGAIMGVMGAFLILYPRNDTRCFLLFLLTPRRVDISSYWLLVLYFSLDVIGVLMGGGVVAHLAHVTGFITGALVVGLLTWKGIISPYRNEENLLQMLRVTPANTD